MSFATDRDLLMYEPSVFHDVPLASQQRVRVTDATVSGTALTSSSADFEAAGVGVGGVVLVNGIAHEVVSRTDANTLSVSLPRESTDDEAIAPPAGTAMEAVCRTFAPQIAAVGLELLTALGIDPDDADSSVTEDDILSLSTMVQLEALGTLACIYRGTIAISGDNAGVRAKAEDYERRFGQACRAVNVRIEVNSQTQGTVRKSAGHPCLRRI